MFQITYSYFFLSRDNLSSEDNSAEKNLHCFYH